MNSQLQVARRVDVICNRYFQHTLKIATREKRNKGIRRRVRADSKIPGNLQTFLRVAENKKEHFSYLADRVITIGAENGEVISTNEDTVICNTERVLVDLSPCQQEEADTRLLLLHAANPAKRGCTKVMVRTDVVVIAITHFHLIMMSLSELWIAFGLKTLKIFACA